MNMKKKALMALVTLALMIFILPVVDGEEVNAAETHHLQSDAVNWIKARGNECWWEDVDGGYGCQCVDLIQKYYQWFGYARLSGNAYEYKSGHIPRGSGWYYSNTPIPGAVFVKDADGTWTSGHVGLVYAVDNSKIYTVETNIRSPYDGGNNAGARYSEHPRSGYAATYICPDFPPPISEGKPIGGGAQLVSDGDYHIVSALDSKKGIDVYGNDNTNGTNIHLYANTSDNNQVFTVKYLGDGFYSIRRKTSGKSLDVVGASRQYGANLQLYDYNGSDAQRWVIKPSSDLKYFKILSKCNGLCIDVDKSGTANYTNIKMWEDNGERAQMWKFVACGSWDRQVIKNGRYEIVSALSPTRCADVQEVSKKDGANIHLWTRLKNPNQIFDIQYLGNGYYEMIGVHSGKAIEIGGDSSDPSNANVNIYSRNGSDAQKWIIRSAGDGYYYIVCKGSGLYLDVDKEKSADGTNIKGWIKNGSLAQKWSFVHVHTLVRTPYKNATIKTEGNIEYWTCSACGKLFKDSEGKTEIKKADILIKRTNPVIAKGKAATVKYSKLKKKAQTISRAKAITVSGAQGALAYKKVSVTYSKAKSVKMSKKALKKYTKKATKKITINAKTGKVTVKKGLKKGTYKVKVKVRAAGNANYNPSDWKTVTFTIKVK